jgi:hypothetical protein
MEVKIFLELKELIDKELKAKKQPLLNGLNKSGYILILS